MEALKEFNIGYSGLKLGEHLFDFQLDDLFFQNFDYDSFCQSQIKAKVRLFKKSSSLEFDFSFTGDVEVICDTLGEPYQQPLSGESSVKVKFSELRDDSNEEILVLPYNEYQLNVAQYLYELVILSIPLKLESPEAKGERGDEVREQWASKLDEVNDQSDKTDPRWDKLKDLLS